MVKECDNLSVGVIIRDLEGKIALLKRAKFPVGIAAPAGHVDDHGSLEQTAIQEVQEELGLTIHKSGLHKVIDNLRVENQCRRPGGDHHAWTVFETADFSGKLQPSEDETKGARWYTPSEIQQLADRTKAYQTGNISEEEWQAEPGLEEIWLNFLQRLGIL